MCNQSAFLIFASRGSSSRLSLFCNSMRKVIIVQRQLTITHNCSPGGIITGVIFGNDNFLYSDKTRVFARETPHCQTHVLKLRALSRVRVIYLWEKSLFVMYITLSNEAKKMFHKQHEINLQNSRQFLANSGKRRRVQSVLCNEEEEKLFRAPSCA